LSNHPEKSLLIVLLKPAVSNSTSSSNYVILLVASLKGLLAYLGFMHKGHLEKLSIFTAGI